MFSLCKSSCIAKAAQWSKISNPFRDRDNPLISENRFDTPFDALQVMLAACNVLLAHQRTTMASRSEAVRTLLLASAARRSRRRPFGCVYTVLLARQHRTAKRAHAVTTLTSCSEEGCRGSTAPIPQKVAKAPSGSSLTYRCRISCPVPGIE